MSYVLIYNARSNSLRVLSLSSIQSYPLSTGYVTLATFDTQKDAKTAIGVFRSGQASSTADVFKPDDRGRY